jgi:hypothetical protein
VLDSNLIAFVRRSLRSIWALEVLLLLRRSGPAFVTVGDISREPRATPFLVRRLLDQLQEEGLVERDQADGAKFHPATEDLAKLCDLLDIASRERPIALRDAMFNAPNDKLQNFANAFRFTEADKKKDQ